MRAKGPLVLLEATDAEFERNLCPADHHVLVRERVGQAVMDHGVEQLGVTHLHAHPCTGHQVRCAAHALHAAGHDHVGVTVANQARRRG